MNLWMDVDAALSEVPVNLLPLIDATDFKTIEDAVAYNASGLALYWHFVTTGGAYTVTAVTPTTAGTYDWTDQGAAGVYTIEIPASGGASINNDTEGFGWFTGVATGVLPWRGPVIGFRAAAINDVLIDSAYSTTRGLAGTALPNAAAEASGGLATLSAAQASNGTINANVHRWLTGTPNALQSGRVDSYLGAVATGVIAAASFAASALDAVWSTTTRLLTAGTNIVLAKGTGVTGFTDLSAAAVNAEVDTAIADAALATAANLSTVAGYLDTEIAAILADTNELQTDWVNGGRLDLILDARASQASVDTIDGIVDDILVDTGTTLQGELDGIQADTEDIQARLPAALVSGRIDASVGAMASGVLTATAIAADAITAAKVAADVTTELQSGLATASALATVAGYLDTEIASILSDTTTIKGTTDKLDDTLEDDAGTFRFTTNALEQAPTGGSAPSAADIADAVWEEAITDHSGTSGSTAEALNAAGSAGDPWTTSLPGSYTGSQAGKILADVLVDTGTTLQGELDGIQADTEDIQARLPAALVSGRIDASVGAMAANVLTAASVAADVTTELQSGLATASAVSTLQTSVDDIPTNAELSAAIAAGDDATLAAIAALNNLSQANIRTAIGLGSANLDTQLADLPTNSELATALGTADDAVLAQVALVKAKTDLIPATPASTGDAMTLTSGERNAIADAHLDRTNGVETGLTVRQAHRLEAAAAAGKLSGAATTSVVIRNAVADSKDRITATVDEDGNRSAVTTDLT